MSGMGIAGLAAAAWGLAAGLGLAGPCAAGVCAIKPEPAISSTTARLWPSINLFLTFYLQEWLNVLDGLRTILSRPFGIHLRRFEGSPGLLQGVNELQS